jgi:hypothetical protein
MSLDIQPGDVLVRGSDEYPVTAVGDYVWQGAASPGLRRQMTTTYSVKRAPSVVGGARGPAVTHIASVMGMPLDSVSPAAVAETHGGDYRYVQMYTATVMDGEGRYLVLTVEVARR